MKQLLIILTIAQIISSCGQKIKIDNMKEVLTDDKFEIIYKPESSIFSGQQLKIIPVDPNFEPSKEQQRNSIRFLMGKFPDNEIRSICTEKVEFIDQGENFNSVSCNHCGKNLEIEFWQQEMDIAYQTEFNDLSILTPCCKMNTTLNDLKYDFPAGFSKYQLIIYSVENGINETIELIQGLKKEIRIEIKMIWAKY